MPPKKEGHLDWQNKCTSVTQRGDHLLDSGLWADCSFIVGDEEQIIIPAHKLILAMASPVFEAMLFGSMAEGRPIAITDISTSVFQNLLRYIYTDKIHANSFESLCELIYVSKKYMLRGLSKDCVKKLKTYLNCNNVCHAYELAIFFEEHEFAKHCLEEIFKNTSLVVKHASFAEASLNTVVEIFKQDVMDLTSELHLFQAIEYYYNKLKTAGENKNDDSSEKISTMETENVPQNEASQNENETGDVESNDQCESLDEYALKLRPAVKYIRFLRLTPEQFASGPASSPLLTVDEAYSILMNIANPVTREPIPADLSDNREARTPPYIPYLERASCAVAHPGRASFAEAHLVFHVYNCKTRRRQVSSTVFPVGDTVWQIVVDPFSTEPRKVSVKARYCKGGSRRHVHAIIRVRSLRPGVADLVEDIDQFTFRDAELGFRNILTWYRLVQGGFIGSNSHLMVEFQIGVSSLPSVAPLAPPSSNSASGSASNATTSNPTRRNPTRRNPTRRNPTSRNPTRRNATRRNPTRRNPTRRNPTSDSSEESDSDASTLCPSISDSD